MKPLSDLLIWNDAQARCGTLNMAIDEALLRSISELPILRFYSWSRPSVSFGYFESLADAQRAFPPAQGSTLDYIRRWTGGGIVDHRIDLTYTLAIPRSHPMATLRGAESYSIIHQIVADALKLQGVKCTVIAENTGAGSHACFENPVAYDIVTPTGAKLAGAGQKRSRYGLLHQGSVVGIKNLSQWQHDFSQCLSQAASPWTPSATTLEMASTLNQEKYATPEWLNKR